MIPSVDLGDPYIDCGPLHSFRNSSSKILTSEKIPKLEHRIGVAYGKKPLPTTPDHHSLLNAVLGSYNMQMRHVEHLTLDGLKDLIKKEIDCDVHAYNPFIPDRNKVKLFPTMIQNYLEGKEFQKEAVYLMPLVIANALGVRLLIERELEYQIIECKVKTDEIIAVQCKGGHFSQMLII